MQSNNVLVIIGLASLGAVVFFILGYSIRKYHAKTKLKSAEEKARKALEDAARDADRTRREAELQAKDMQLKMRTEFESETKARRSELITLEKRLIQKEENMDRKMDILDRKEKDIDRRDTTLGDKEKRMGQREKELDGMVQEEKDKLQKVSGMTREEAKQVLLRRLEDEVKQEAAVMIKRSEEEAREKADKEARKIIGLAIQRCAAEHTVETTVSVVNLPNDEMKGRIIGREGRNIRALEIATGVDVIIDDTPEAVILSGFDPIKREIAARRLRGPLPS